jgi:transcriptional regulator with XRE-family HTH domain
MSNHAENINRLAEIVKSARHERGLTVRALGQQIGIHHSSITRLERGEFLRPTPDFLKRIARALELELSDLFHLAGHTPSGRAT